MLNIDKYSTDPNEYEKLARHFITLEVICRKWAYYLRATKMNHPKSAKKFADDCKILYNTLPAELRW
jgi:hypothetical protein